MPLMKFKPTSAGRRSAVRVVSPELHKGDPYAPLVEKQSRTGGRNHHGRTTTRHMGGGPGLGPGPAMQAALHGPAHQQAPGRVEGDMIDAVAARVVGLQHGGVAVGVGRRGQRLGAAQPGAVLGQFRRRDAGARDGLLEGRVGVE